MSLSTQPYKGARDFYPEDMRRQKWMFSKLRQVVERFGYEEYNAPLLEPLELYAAKTGDEIVNEQTYQFEDRGGRKVAVRPEMTPSVSRMVAARRQELAYPLRLYNIGNRWRYERPQRGRLREFWQMDVDLFGVDGIQAEAELISLADQIMQDFGAKPSMYEIRVNSRKLLNKRIIESGVRGPIEAVIRVLDRYEKVSREETLQNLRELVMKPGQLLDQLENDGPSEDVKKLVELLEKMGINAVSKETLARGFDYYTDVVFEVFDTNLANNRSMFGGGRYSGLVGLFGVEPIEAVGFAVGDVTLANFLETNKLLPALRPETDVYVALIGNVLNASQQVIADLRGMGLNVAVDLSSRKLDKQIKAAAKKGIRYVLFIGETEIASGRYKLKDLVEGTETEYSLERLVSVIKDYRKS